jgi:hypothetical protein
MVDPHLLRPPIDVERFVILLQAKDNPEDIEEKMNPADKESSVQMFIERARWRRKKSQYDVGVQEDDFTLQNADEEWEYLRTIGSEEARTNRKPDSASEGWIGTSRSDGTRTNPKLQDCIGSDGRGGRDVEAGWKMGRAPSAISEQDLESSTRCRRILGAQVERRIDLLNRESGEIVKSSTTPTSTIENPLPPRKLDIQLRARPGPRTVEERIETKHAAGRLRFKKWRGFVNQEQEPSPLSDTEEEEELDSGPPSYEEDDEQLIRNGIVRTVSFHDSQEPETEGDDSRNVGKEVGKDQAQSNDDGMGHQVCDGTVQSGEELGGHTDILGKHKSVGEIDPAVRFQKGMERKSDCSDRQANQKHCDDRRAEADSSTRGIGSLRRGSGRAVGTNL